MALQRRRGRCRREVSTPGGSERLCFLTLPSLIAWIARLEPCPAPAGLR